MAVLEQIAVEVANVAGDALVGGAKAIAHDNILTYGALSIGGYEIYRRRRQK